MVTSILKLDQVKPGTFHHYVVHSDLMEISNIEEVVSKKVSTKFRYIVLAIVRFRSKWFLS
jgi:hypothetical protein